MNGALKNNENVALKGYKSPRISDLRCAYAFNSTSSRNIELSQIEFHIVDSLGKREQRVF
tara:strand:+ start:1331 stop:1510 length:180 start_codon:yes stop_codon:yes gene_type:complete